MKKPSCGGLQVLNKIQFMTTEYRLLHGGCAQLYHIRHLGVEFFWLCKASFSFITLSSLQFYISMKRIY